MDMPRIMVVVLSEQKIGSEKTFLMVPCRDRNFHLEVGQV
jgi:hypothetical protein